MSRVGASMVAPLPGALIVLTLTVLWGMLRLVAFGETIVPLTYVVPMLACVWTRRRWHVWAMALVFAGFGVVEIFKIVGPDEFSLGERWIFVSSTVFNILAGASVVHLIIELRTRLDERNARLAAQNDALEAQAAELAQQNEEIKVQTEELAQQNEEIESQAEELAGQNEELQEINERLEIREEILQGLLESTRSPEAGLDALRETCRRSLSAIGKPADCVAVLRIDPDRLRVKVQASFDGVLVPGEWPREGSIAQIVMAENRTTYVSDLRKQPEVGAPFDPTLEVRSILAAPMRVAGSVYGIVVACSRHEAHWSQEQFTVIEWVAAQCGLITESIRWQKALQQRTQELEAANQAKDHFLAMLSHELRTPLTPVLAAAGVLEQDERIPEDAREDIRMVRRNVAIQSRLIDDLLDLTRLSRGKLDLEAQQLDLAGLLHETAVIVSPDLDARSQKIEMDLHAAEGCCIEGDGPRLQQVFWNLLKNAIKFSPAHARIKLAAKRVPGDARRIAVEVIDHGIGLDATHIERIFRPFEQVAVKGKQRSGDGGLGLGLAIAKAIVELHHGTIRVTSGGLGQGTTFAVELPLTERKQVTEPSTTRSGWSKSGLAAAQRILLVEDHGDTGRIIARLLRNSGYDVEHAETATAAYAMFCEKTFDLVISDLGLPDESGLVLMKKLREKRPDLPGICLSGYGMEDDLAACREAGFTDHLTKPVDMKRLHAAIARAVMSRGV